MSHSSSSSVEVLSRNKSSFNEVIDFSQGENENLCSSCDDSSEQNLISPQFIGRQVLRSEGVYIEGHVQGTEVNFTVDTGASRTVLSRRAFQQIPFAKRPLLKKSNMLASADGKPLHELGKAIFDIKLEDLPFEIEVVVAEIEDEALLGLDVLMKADCGPANLRLSDGIMLLGDTSIPCQQIGLPERVRKIRVADNFSIPPRSEMLIDVFIDRYEDDQILGSFDFVLDPTEDILQRYPVVMAPTIVNIEKDVTSLVRILNPFDTEFTLYQDTVIGEAESLIKEPEILVSCEDKAEVSNFSVVRRIKLGDHKPVQWETNTGIIRNISKKGTADGGKSGIVPDYSQDLFLESTKERSAEECDIICNLLNKFSNAFSKNDMDLGLTNLTEHCIETGDARPVKQPPRRVPLAYANEEKKLVDQMLQQGIIQKSHSPWASPLVLVVKKSGKLRPCCDFRRLNKLSRLDSFPIPRIQDCLNTLSGSTIFSTFDLISGFNQIPVKKEDIPKTAFVTKYGLFEYKTLPFGLCNGPSTCQRLMELVLNGLQWQTCLIYLDDIIVFSPSFDQHIERLEEVLFRIL